MARPKFDPKEKKIPVSCSNLVEQLINHETVFLDKKISNCILSRYGNETGLFSYEKDVNKPYIVRKQGFKVNRRTTHHVFFKVI